MNYPRLVRQESSLFISFSYAAKKDGGGQVFFTYRTRNHARLREMSKDTLDIDNIKPHNTRS
jgi:hypothetical protein